MVLHIHTVPDSNVVMASDRAILLRLVISFCCALMVTAATEEESGLTDNKASDRHVNSSSYAVENATSELEGCPPLAPSHDAGLRYAVAKFNFKHVQTPLIVAAWILFVTLAKIGNKSRVNFSIYSLSITYNTNLCYFAVKCYA